MALPPYDFLTSAPTDQLGTGLGKDFDYLSAYRSGQGIRNDVDYTNQPMMAVMPPPFTIGDNPDVISDMSLADYKNFQKYMSERGAADLINTQNQIKPIDGGSDLKGIGEIILPPIAGSGKGGGVEGPINYNNLIVRDQSTGTGIDSKTFLQGPEFYKNNAMTEKEYADRISKIREYNKNLDASYTDAELREIIDLQTQSQNLEPQKTGILEKLKNFDISKMPSIAFLNSILSKQDPRTTALRNFYGDNFGLTSSGSVASGIMKNYNPVSGGLLNMISGGKFGDETQYGLGEAIDERMDNIKDMLGSKYNYNYTNDSQMYKDMIAGKIGKYGVKGHTSAAENYFKLKSLREKEKIALQAQEKIKEEKKTTDDSSTTGGGFKYETKTTGTPTSNQYGTYTQTVSPSDAVTSRESRRGNYDSSSTKDTNTTASKASSKGTNQGYSQHFRDGGIVTL